MRLNFSDSSEIEDSEESIELSDDSWAKEIELEHSVDDDSLEDLVDSIFRDS